MISSFVQDLMHNVKCWYRNIVEEKLGGGQYFFGGGEDANKVSVQIRTLIKSDLIWKVAKHHHPSERCGWLSEMLSKINELIMSMATFEVGLDMPVGVYSV